MKLIIFMSQKKKGKVIPSQFNKKKSNVISEKTISRHNVRFQSDFARIGIRIQLRKMFYGIREYKKYT